MRKMGIFQRIITGLAKRSVIVSTQDNYNAMRMAGGDYGVAVTNDSALKLTALYAGIRLRAENIASLPKEVKKMSSKGPINDTKHPAYKLINIAPNDYTNVFDFWFTINANLDGWGNAYALIERDEYGVPVALHQVHPREVTVTLVSGKKYYSVRAYDNDRAFLNGVKPAEDMLHFMLVSFNGIEGVNPILYNASSLGKALAIGKFGAEYFKKGGNVKAVLETDKSLGDAEYKAFMDHFSKVASNFETPLLEYGIKYKQIGINPVAAQLIQSEVMSIQDIARILNIPPHLLMELSHATFSNIEQQNIQFAQLSLRPTCKRIEVEIESKLFTSKERAKYSVKFSLSGLMRGDTAARSQYYHNAILDGYYSRNEVRALEGLPAIEGLDEMLYPLNMGVVKDGQVQDPNSNSNE